MLVVTYHLDDAERTRARRLVIRAPSITVGRDSGCTVAVGDDAEVAAVHLQITVQPAGYLVTPLAPALVNGAPLAGATTCMPNDTIQIGRTIVKLRPDPVVTIGTPPDPGIPTFNPVSPMAYHGPPANPPFPVMPTNPPLLAEPPLPPEVVNPPRIWRKELSRDPDEQRFLTALRVKPADPDQRMVYADWLEQRGRLVHAQVVRGDESADRDDVVAESDPQWRAVASCRPIADCTDAKCPRQWHALVAVAHDERVRRCTVCSRRIRYCLHVLDPRGAETRGEGFVLDSSLTTYPGRDTLDTLDEPPPRR